MKGEVRSGPDAQTRSPWGHVIGVGLFSVIVVFIPGWAEPFTMPKVILLTAAALACTPLVWARRRALLTQRAPLALLGAFLIFALLSQAASGAPQAISLWGDWLRRSGTLTLIALGLLLAAGAVLRRPEARTVLAWIVVAGVPATAYGLIQLVGADPYPWNNQGWVVSTFGNPNFAAAGLAILALLTAGLAVVGGLGTAWRVLMAPLAALEALLALQTGSSQAIFALAAGAIAGAVAALMRWGSPRRGVALVALALAGAVATGLAALALVGQGPLVPLISADTLMFRQWYWGAAIRMATSHPLLGVGPDGYGRFYGEFRSSEAAEMFTLGASAAHDVPLQWAATLGIPAGLLYLALMACVAVVVLRRLWLQGPSASLLAVPLLAAWAAYQVQSLVSIDATSIAALGWIMTGLLLAVTSMEVPEPATAVGGWLVAGVMAVVGSILWLPAVIASNASNSVVQGTTEQEVYDAIALVEGTTLPCEPSVKVAQWMVQVAPSEQTVDGVLAGARADDRCYGLVTAAADFSLQVERPGEALGFAQQGVAIDPLNFGQWILLARAQHAIGDDQAARASLNKAADLSPAALPEVDQVAAELGLAPLP